MFSESNPIRNIWPEMGIAYYARQFETGERHEFPTQVPEIGQSKNITLLPAGKIRTWNENRDKHLDVPARPGRIYGGLLLPGQYIIEALEPTVYVCLALIPWQQLVGLEVPMFNLESFTLQPGNSLDLAYMDNYRAVICLYGSCTVNGEPLAAGNKRLIADGEEVQIEATAYCEIAGYKVL